jgi:hypothetical protein
VFGAAGVIPLPAGGRGASDPSRMKPAGGYISAWPFGEASFGVSWPSLDHDGDTRCAAAIDFKVVALLDISSMLIFVSPKASCKLNAFNGALW